MPMMKLSLILILLILQPVLPGSNNSHKLANQELRMRLS